MTTLHNEITINAPIEKVWGVLANLEALEHYDPVVKKSTLLTTELSGLGASRKCDCADNKNWFEEQVTEWKPNEALTFEITSCTIPMQRLTHRYTLFREGNTTKVKQEMNYKMKFGFFGTILDKLFVKNQTDQSIKRFFSGLKTYTENEAAK